MDLQLPIRRKITNSSFDTRTEVVRAWVDELPLINAEKSWSLLDNALKEINSLSISTKNRLEALELLATSVICVAETMKNAFLAKPIPLRDHNLKLAWGVIPKRRFSRHAKTAKVGLVVGLNAIHQRVTGPGTESIGSEETREDQHYLQDPTFEASTTFRVNPFDNSGRRIVTTAKTPARGASSKDSTNTPRIESWTMANISAGGYSLLWDSVDSSNAQVGELVAIIEQNNLCEDEWHLGVVRWMKCTRTYGLELGIQMLSPSAQAVWAYMDESGIHSGRKMQGILLPEVKMLRQRASLLLPTLPFRAGCIATLETAGSLENIKLSRQLENTGSFAQYHFYDSIYD